MLFLAVNLMDRYYGRRNVYREHFRLVALAALLLAAKYDEQLVWGFPYAAALCTLDPSGCDAFMVRELQAHMLDELGWDMGARAHRGLLPQRQRRRRARGRARR